jgi:serine protease Do
MGKNSTSGGMKSNTQLRLPLWLQQTWLAACLALAAHPFAACEPVPADEPLYTNAPSVQQANNAVHAGRSNAITQAVKICSPAIVGINVTEVREQAYRDPMSLFDELLGYRPRSYTRKYEVRGLGSGFLISSDGYIVTNDHVAGNASKIVVTTTDGKKYDARIVGTDATTDVALLKIDGQDFPFLTLSNSENVQVGEWAIAFGNPFGLFTINAKPTVTVGVVSNTNVDFTQPDEEGENRVYRGMLQTDAAISSGNSGGPLVNALGEVIGVNTVIYSTAQSSRGAGSIGIGFSIPINRVKKVVEKLRKSGGIDRDFWTGMQVETLTEELANHVGVDQQEGAIIMSTQRGSPADQAGCEPGDVIVEIDGSPVRNVEDVEVVILDAETNQTLPLRVIRAGKSVSLKLTLIKRNSTRAKR